MSRTNCKAYDGAGGLKPASFGLGWEFWGASKTAHIRAVAPLRDLPPRSGRSADGLKSSQGATSETAGQAAEAGSPPPFCQHFAINGNVPDDGGTRLRGIEEEGRAALPTTALWHGKASRVTSELAAVMFGCQFGTKTALCTTALRHVTANEPITSIDPFGESVVGNGTAARET
jgi:hypothetical protein